MGRLAVVLLLSSAIGACQSGGADGSIDEWHIDRTPELVVADDGSTEKQFTRLVGAVRLPDGAIAIGDARTNEVRVFDSTGTFQSRLTRTGDGPAEVRGLQWIARSGDTLIAGMSLGYVRLVHGPRASPPVRKTLASDPGRPAAASLVGAGSDGSVLLTGMVGFAFRAVEPVAHVLRDSVWLRLTNRSLSDSGFIVGRFPGQSSLILPHPDAPGGMKFGRLTTAPQLVYTFAGDQLWIGETDHEFLLRVSTSSGATDTVWLNIDPRAWNEPALDRVRDRIANEPASDADRAFALAMLDAKWRSPSPPLFADSHGAADGSLWVELYREDADTPPAFLILDRTGEAIARASAPRPMRITEVGPDYVLAIEKGEDDVPRVAQYRLRRSGG